MQVKIPEYIFDWLGPLAPLARLLVTFLPGFVLVAGLALGVDMVVISLLVALGVALQLAVIGGYMAGNVVCYLLLCGWVYRVPWRRVKRYARYLVGNLTGLVVRGGTASALVWLGFGEHSLWVVVAAVGLSFTTNYLVTTLWAIRPLETR